MNSVRILTKSYINNKGSQRQPPTPLHTPQLLTLMPKAPNFPTAPRAPKVERR
jgi:hypothetical protein